MKARALALVAALAAVALAPVAVYAAKKEEPGAVTEAQRKQGMAEAPAVVQAAGLPCQVTDARFVGKTEDKKAKTSSSYYEVACQQGMGFVLQAPSGAAPTAFTCIEADFPADGSKPSLSCMLPANADPKAAHALLTVGESKANASIPAPELAAWTMVASEMLNLDETITK